jgi:hypothetical protein
MPCTLHTKIQRRASSRAKSLHPKPALQTLNPEPYTESQRRAGEPANMPPDVE